MGHEFRLIKKLIALNHALDLRRPAQMKFEICSMGDVNLSKFLLCDDHQSSEQCGGLSFDALCNSTKQLKATSSHLRKPQFLRPCKFQNSSNGQKIVTVFHRQISFFEIFWLLPPTRSGVVIISLIENRRSKKPVDRGGVGEY